MRLYLARCKRGGVVILRQAEGDPDPRMVTGLWVTKLRVCDLYNALNFLSAEERAIIADFGLQPGEIAEIILGPSTEGTEDEGDSHNDRADIDGDHSGG